MIRSFSQLVHVRVVILSDLHKPLVSVSDENVKDSDEEDGRQSSLKQARGLVVVPDPLKLVMIGVLVQSH